MADTVLVIGGGGREHALSWKLSQSQLVKQVLVCPGNAGTQKNRKIDNVALNVKNFEEITSFCKEKSVSLVVVGPEDPLAAGLADHLTSAGVSCFGPSAKAAQIEASKEFAKKFMYRHGIPTAKFESFTDAQAACQHINSATYKALVVKASGLAAGKGVVVAESMEEACQAVRSILQDKTFGSAGDTVVIEELLEGEEVSCLAFTDGTNVAMMPPAQDHKRLSDGDQGPNTGGMGAICPYPKLNDKDLKCIEKDVIQKAVDGLKSEGFPYIGVLYAGLMLTKDGPKVLEFNCRFGDPETQSILPLLKTDLYAVCKACTCGSLSNNVPQFDTQKCNVGVVMVSGGYPGSYKKGLPISGLENINKENVQIFHAGTATKDGHVVTSGGRVLAVVASDTDFESASSEAQETVKLVKFEHSYYRKDIGFHVLSRYNSKQNGMLTYESAGVNIEAGNCLVQAIKPLAANTRRSGCDASLGGFGALFDIKAAGYTDPILVSGTDGVGTKLKIAQQISTHDTIGVDLVAMCVNDILAHGAEPLFFLDYFATGKLDVSIATEIVSGIAKGCKEAGCALVGGETAEMPGIYSGEDYDLAGFAVGAVERNCMLPRTLDIKPGDVVIGLPSSGIHSNGFSLVRKVIEKQGLQFDMPSPFTYGKTLGEDLLTPTTIYVKPVLSLMKQKLVKAFAHITGGGLIENIPRILPEGTGVQLDASLWKLPSVFGWLAEKGNISAREMSRTFNCGVGGVLIMEPTMSESVLQQLQKQDVKASVIGHVCQSEIALVISNKPGVLGLQRAEKAGIPTKVINHKSFKSREEFDEAVHQCLIGAHIDLVCLAGFMRILTGGFVKKWNGRMLNIHPSLLPSFKGGNAHDLVIKSRVRISGCTVHFVAEEVDAGAILVQESVPVYPGDTTETLSERVKKVEHKAFPAALELVASEQAVLQDDGTIKWML
ncbi:hypothetical protein KUTeg_002139 [Tegillarca granosa]|uniref:Trifunctional purine biosynthetic protein adenosine-3 n=1 Tax=Tegillarca granosa TaxID=220873 RepID=A0ABQ9FUV6_TEGGR|nr:hypothetical protein KUTeg_002139 [Tegillarca granosa]